VLNLSEATFATFDGDPVLEATLPNSVISCLEAEPSAFVCVRIFDDNTVALKLLNIGPSNRGDGLFEVCAPDLDAETCFGNFINNPDGALAVSLGTPLASTADDAQHIQAQGGAYLQYYKQGETDEPNTLGQEFDMTRAASLTREVLNRR